MALAFVATAKKEDASFAAAGGSLASFNVNCGAGADCILVFVASNIDGGTHTVSGVTAGGAAMTSLGAPVSTAFVSKLSGWRIVGAFSGNVAIVVTYGAAAVARDAVVIALAYSGADQTDPDTGYVTDTEVGEDSVLGLTVASAVGDLVIVAGSSTNGVWSSPSGTERNEASNAGEGGVSIGVMEVAGAASVVTTYTAPTNALIGLGFSLEAAAAAAVPVAPGRAAARAFERAFSRGMARSMEKINGLWRPTGSLVAPVGIHLAGARP